MYSIGKHKMILKHEFKTKHAAWAVTVTEQYLIV